MCIIKYIVYIDYFTDAYNVELILSIGNKTLTRVIIEKGFSDGPYSVGSTVEYNNLPRRHPTFNSVQDCIKYLSLCGVL